MTTSMRVVSRRRTSGWWRWHRVVAEYQGSVTFGNDESAFNTEAFGAPMSELVTEMRVGPCVRCGTEPGDTDGGYLENIRVEDGVLIGDTVCLTCAEDED